MRRAPRSLLVAALLAVTSAAVPAAAQQVTRGELDAAREGLDGTLAALDATADAVEDAEQRAAEATATLQTVRAELVLAEREVVASTEEAATANAALSAAVGALGEEAGALARTQAEVDRRAASVWMRGTGAEQELLGRMLGPGDVHDLLLRARAVRGAAERDRRDLAEGLDIALGAARDRDALARLRARAGAATARAVEAQDAAALLVGAGERAEALARDALAERAAALAALEADVEGRQALVAALQEQLRAQRVAELDAWVEDEVELPADGPAPPWSDALPSHGQRLAPAIERAAAQAGIDARLLAALVWTESNFRHASVSGSGAMGLTQLMPSTAAGLGVDPRDPAQNLLGGARYLRIQLDRFGRVDLALAAYNAGPGRVEAAGPGIPAIVETELYVLRVLERVEALGGP